MQNFELLGDLAFKLHQEFRSMYYVLLPIFFSVGVLINWFRGSNGGGNFIDLLKRAFIATLLLVGFQEATDIILVISNGISDKISDMSGLDNVMQMAAQKTKDYTLSPSSVLLAFNDLMVAVLSFLSYVIVYIARYVMIAVYHFSWIFLMILSPRILLFHMFSSKMTYTLFSSMIQIASWKIVWAVLSAILIALPFGNAYAADGNYLTVIVLNFVVALCLIATPKVVNVLVGGGFASLAGNLSPITAATMIAAPAYAAKAVSFGRSSLSRFGAFNSRLGMTGKSFSFSGGSGNAESVPETKQLPAPNIKGYLPAPKVAGLLPPPKTIYAPPPGPKQNS